MMGMMLKAHKKEEKAAQKDKKREGRDKAMYNSKRVKDDEAKISTGQEPSPGTKKGGMLEVTRSQLKQPSSSQRSTAKSKVHPPRLEKLDSLDSLTKESVYSGVGRLERQQRTLLDALKSELAVAAPAAEVGSYQAISRGLHEKLWCVRSALSRGLRHLLASDLKFALAKKAHNRLWMAFYRDIDLVQQRLKEAVTQEAPVAVTGSLRKLLLTLIGAAEQDLNLAVTSLEATEGSSTEDCIKAMQSLMISMGDLARYRQLHRPAEEPRDWSVAEALYHKAFRLRPEEGRVWNQLAMLATYKNDNVAAFYHYLRSLCAREPFPSKDNILLLHESCRRQIAALAPITALDGPNLEEHTHRFLLYLLGAAGTCLSRIDLNAFEGYLALTSRHLVSCIQMHLLQEGLEETAKRLPVHLMRVMLLAMCTVVGCFSAWIERGNEEYRWPEDPYTCAAIQLCFTVASTLAGMQKQTRVTGWERVTIGPVCVFLDWLMCESYFGEGMKNIQPALFERTILAVLAFSNSVFRVCNPSVGNPDAALPEDVACQGLPPLERAVAPRIAAEALRLKEEQLGSGRSPAPTLDAWRTRVARLKAFAEWAVGREWVERGVKENSYVPAKFVPCEDAPGPAVYQHLQADDAQGALRHKSNGDQSVTSTGAGDLSLTDNEGDLLDDSADNAAVAVALAGLEDDTDDAIGSEGQRHGQQGLGMQYHSVDLGSGEKGRDLVCSLCFNPLEGHATECELCGTPVGAKESDIGAIDSLHLKATEDAVGSSPQVSGLLSNVNMDAVFASASRPITAVGTIERPSRAPGGGGSPYQQQQQQQQQQPQQKQGYGWIWPPPPSQELPLVLVDAPNVAMRHGLKKKFSCKGIQLTVDHFRLNGHRVIAFMPDYYLDETRSSGMNMAAKLGMKGVKAQQCPDDVPMLKAMVEEGTLITTPPQDYDDSYVIKYAHANGGYVVTNDLYRDHVNGMGAGKKQAKMRVWLKNHLISYTFVANEFLPNPDFSFDRHDQGG
ncbi:unnamed protein product [Chrysoparadoxa australica]